MRINRKIVGALEDALAHCDLDRHGSEEVEVARLYIETWIQGPLALALRAIKDEPITGDYLTLNEYPARRR